MEIIENITYLSIITYTKYQLYIEITMTKIHNIMIYTHLCIC